MHGTGKCPIINFLPGYGKQTKLVSTAVRETRTHFARKFLNQKFHLCSISRVASVPL